MKRIISLMLTLAVALSLLILPTGAASTPEEALAQAGGPAAQPLDVAYGTGPIQWALVYTNPEEPGRACFLLQTGEGEHRPVTMGDEESGFVYLPDSLAVEGDTVTLSAGQAVLFRR